MCVFIVLVVNMWMVDARIAQLVNTPDHFTDKQVAVPVFLENIVQEYKTQPIIIIVTPVITEVQLIKLQVHVTELAPWVNIVPLVLLLEQIAQQEQWHQVR